MGRPPVGEWSSWSPADLATRLAGVSVCWHVVGGWSVDLSVGRETRPHLDIEIATIRSDLDAIRDALKPLVMYTVGGGEVRRLDAAEFPPLDRHQHWMLDDHLLVWRVDVMVEPGDRATWVYRRDERITAPRMEMVARTAYGIPYLRPHGALLYKARRPQPKDEADFDTAVGHMGVPERAWLVNALELVHPGHHWLARLHPT
jgi:hypothetical protein